MGTFHFTETERRRNLRCWTLKNFSTISNSVAFFPRQDRQSSGSFFKDFHYYLQLHALHLVDHTLWAGLNKIRDSEVCSACGFETLNMWSRFFFQRLSSDEQTSLTTRPLRADSVLQVVVRWSRRGMSARTCGSRSLLAAEEAVLPGRLAGWKGVPCCTAALNTDPLTGLPAELCQPNPLFLCKVLNSCWVVSLIVLGEADWSTAASGPSGSPCLPDLPGAARAAPSIPSLFLNLGFGVWFRSLSCSWAGPGDEFTASTWIGPAQYFLSTWCHMPWCVLSPLMWLVAGVGSVPLFPVLWAFPLQLPFLGC